MEQFLIYSGLVLGLFIFGFVWVKYFSKKVTKEAEENFKKIIKVIDYIAKNVDFKFNAELSIVVKYVYEALDFIDDFEYVQDIKQKKELVKEKALYILKENKIEVNNDVITLVDEAINFIIDNTDIEKVIE